MNMTNNLELRERAFKYVKERRWDYLLALTFLEIQHYSTWSQRDDFETDWNIGLTSISHESRLLGASYDRKDTNFIKAKYQEIDFSVGGFQSYGEVYTAVLSLLIEDKPVITIDYSVSDREYLRAEDYRMRGVEELHADPKIDELLLGIEKLIKDHNKEQNRKQAERRNQQYDGKFSFGEETESKTGIKPAEARTSQPSTKESASYQLGKMFGKYFK